ncbi:MAG TPA: hypothetical protein VKM55_10165 [Candidatus Lokiarchaeia archaeon]|nr:hypothetical protein [Candidatus Lokiarchaeia archaeon]
MPTSRELSKVDFERVLAATITIAGEGHHHEAIELAYCTLARAFVGLNEDSIVAVTVYVTLQGLCPRLILVHACGKSCQWEAAS